MKKTTWDKILKIIIAVASAVIGAFKSGKTRRAA